ncbi:protein ENHANCED DOWNY MILDEW 2-like [Gastrolobium bilobum]|uniref:protein ENHANCED DOWNY MILDEW 2-like n=1 Tax=Gastrolobium bilobum TaxID=150636 RepID=UPI002AB30EAC|nr:protein ENHANCED DOWNY MILDEW 2-like [Gastrolobium bilobum]
MASSDEEGEIVPDFVNSYWFENDKAEFVSLSSLTLLWSISEIKCDLATKVYLRGTTDDGLQKIYKQIIGWRFDLSFEQPEISVLLKDKNWITLQRPRKCFESTIRRVLVTVYWLHFVKWSPEESRISIWSKILNAFSSFDVTPSEDDVLNHVTFIREAAKRDKDLTKSKYLLNLIEKACSNEGFHEDVQTTKKSKFILDAEKEVNNESDGELNTDGEQYIGYDTVCAICDNGGDILPCEGRCLRSFHAAKEDGRESFCESLGYTNTQVNAFPNFYCKNCKYKQHQCFACGKLGSSDVSSNAEVFPCVTANCGRYYHPECVARLFSPGIDTEQEEMRKRIAIAKTFVCPLHICSLCRKGENINVHDLQFAMCRRCPKAYHRKCLPKEISFTFDYDKGIEQRAWNGLLDRRILMYCMDHDIVRELGTPARDQLVFPDMDVKRKICSIKLLGKEVTITSRRSTEDLRPKKKLVPNQVTKESVSIQSGGSAKVMEEICFKKDIGFSTGSIKIDMVRKNLKVENLSESNRSSFLEKRLSLRNDNLHCSSRLHQGRSQQQKLVGGRIEQTSLEKPLLKNVQTSLNFTNADMENRILSLWKESKSAFNEEEFKMNYHVFSRSSCFTETVFDKNLTQGKVESSVKAIQTALQRLNEGCSIEEAKAICEPGILCQIFIWQKQLKVYLAPFLHGMRYTSFGRHFTKIDKLKEIVDRLHWYVQNGDTVLDFCCGSNDFSCLMKSKLEQMGKLCSFKNYDLFQAKNDFNFEKRDWMSVNAEELPNGSQLIIGLNPPFGVKGYLANKFIDKALTFKPKLLILIVPKVTKRLDRKKGGYDLIWEDDELLSGKSFYLPGSVDIRDKQLEDWNQKPPPLYLWSRPDWTPWHREIAQKHGHIKKKYDVHVKGKDVKNYLMEENHDCYQDYPGLHAPNDFLSIFDGVPDDNGDIAPEEGATSNTLGQLKKTVFSACGSEMEWEDGLPSDEAEEMFIDMDLSSP